MYRRRCEHGLQGANIDFISDSELDQAVSRIKRNHPAWGVVMVEGALNARNIIVPRRRIIEALTRTDPLFTVLRWRAPIERRRYRVPGTTIPASGL